MDYVTFQRELERDEGRKAFPYVDTVGKLTIGIGRNLTDRGLAGHEIDYLFQNDVRIIEDELDRKMPWWRSLSEIRQRIILNMSFMGVTKLLLFVNTMQAVREARWQDAANGMQKSKWHKQVGNRALRLEYMMLHDKVVPKGMYGT